MSKKHNKDIKIEGYGVGVKVIDGNIESALKTFKKLMRDSKRIEECRERQEFLKPSVKKRIMIQKAIRQQEQQDKIDKIIYSS